MKELLKKVFPLVDFYFAEQGISATVANGRKNDNTNDNANLLKNIQIVQLYNTELIILTDKGVTNRESKVRKLTPASFDVLQKVAKNNAENAILGNGIQLFNKAMNAIKGFDATKIVELNGGDVSLPESLDYPARKQAVNGLIDSVLNFDRVEDILFSCSAEVIERVDAKLVKNALRLESEAAVLGNEVTKKTGFLHQILTANETLQPTETTAQFGVVIREQKLAYTEGEVEAFKVLFDNLQTQYKNIQGQLNGLKKTLKDTIRLVDVEFSKQYDADMRVFYLRQGEIAAKQSLIAAQGETLKQELVKEFLALKIQIE